MTATFSYSYTESPRAIAQWSEAFDTAEAAEAAREEFATACGGWAGVDGRTVDGTRINPVVEDAE